MLTESEYARKIDFKTVLEAFSPQKIRNIEIRVPIFGGTNSIGIFSSFIISRRHKFKLALVPNEYKK